MTDQHFDTSSASLSSHILRASKGAYSDALGVTISELGPGRMVGRVDLSDHHLIVPNGQVHAGTVFGLADNCAGWGCIASLPDGYVGFVTIEANINMVATAGPGDTLVATAVMEHSGRTTQVWNVDVARQRGSRNVGLYRCTQMLLKEDRT